MKKVLIVLFALAVVSPVFAQEDPPEGPPPIAVAAHNQVIAFLDLGEVQVSAWDEIYRIHRDAEQPIKEELRILLKTGRIGAAAAVVARLQQTYPAWHDLHGLAARFTGRN